MVSNECRRKIAEMPASNILFWPCFWGYGVHRASAWLARAADSIIILCTAFPISRHLLPNLWLIGLGGLSAFFHNDLIFTNLHWTSRDCGLQSGMTCILYKTTRLRKVSEKL